MATECHRMQGYVYTFTLLLSVYDHGRGLRGSGHYHGRAYLYSRCYRSAVRSTPLERPGGDRSARLTVIVNCRVVVFILRADIIKNHSQQLGTGSFQKSFRLYSHGTGAAP